MYRIHWFCSYILLFTIYSCLSESNNFGDNTGQKIKININDTVSFIKPSNFFFLKLESTQEALIEHIEFIKKEDDKIWILDDKRNSIISFSQEGEFFSRIDRKGKGYGEYLQISDFDIFNQYLYVLDVIQQKLMLFDLNGNFLYEKPCPENKRFASIEVINPNKFILQSSNYRMPGNDYINLTDSSFNILNSAVKINQFGIQNDLRSNGISTSSEMNKYFFTYGAGPIYLINTIDHTITPLIYPDYGKLTYSENEVNLLSGMEAGQLFFDNKRVRSLLFYELQNKYIIKFHYYPFTPRGNLVIYDKSTHEIVNTFGLYIDDHVYQLNRKFSKIDNKFLAIPIESTEATLVDLHTYDKGPTYGMSTDIKSFSHRTIDNPTLLFFSP